ncbi:MAG: endo-1,4-beta-xylanase [Victivallales bacterium]|nr:endo-1,4-beta-xylanase [Victivallales bacterium]
MESRQEVLRPFEEKRDYMKDRIATGIEANKKGFAFLSFVDGAGKPVTDVEVKITQKTHDFKYGANLFMLGEMQDEERNAKYERFYADAFNIATLPFYWNTLEPEQGKPRFAKDSPRIYRRPAPDLCLEFCEANGIEPKAHCLNYPTMMPDWAKGTVAWEKKCLEKRFRELAERYARRIPMWEVTNETFFHRKDVSLYSQPDLIEWSFKLAENYFPGNRLVINEAHSRIWKTDWFHTFQSPYYMQIERALLKGARIDAIGMQYHMFYRREIELESTKDCYDPEQICNVLDTYATLGKPIHITELTIPCYSGNAEDEDIQAEIIKNIYSLWFSHTATDGIIYWNLVDGYAHNAVPGDMTAGENYFYGGLIRYDFTPKPAYNVIRNLFEKEWRTNLNLHTASDSLSFKGFYGMYELEIIAAGKRCTKTIHLGKELNNKFTITLFN